MYRKIQFLFQYRAYLNHITKTIKYSIFQRSTSDWNKKKKRIKIIISGIINSLTNSKMNALSRKMQTERRQEEWIKGIEGI